jgi:hypothetical protein
MSQEIMTSAEAAQLGALYEEYLLEPCKTKAELNQWIQTFLGISFPNCTIDENSNSNPLDFIWDVYSAVLTGDTNRTTFVGAAARASTKTLSVSVLEFLLMLHFGKTIVHLSAILDQSMACIGYLDKFLSLPVMKKFSKTDSQRKKILRNLPPNKYRQDIPPSLRVIVATKESANGMRGNVLCVPGVTEIWVKSWTAEQEKHSCCAKMSAESIFKRVERGEEVLVQTVNEKTLMFEFKPVMKAYKRKEPSRLRITTDTGASITVTREHPLATGHDGAGLTYTKAEDLQIGSRVFLKNKSTQVTWSDFSEIHPAYPVNAVLPFDGSMFTHDDIIVGSLLGDGCVYKRVYPEGHSKAHIKFNPQFSITKSLSARGYLEWISQTMNSFFGKGDISTHSWSGYTGADQLQYNSGNHPSLGVYRDKWYGSDRKKIIPRDLKLTMGSFAIWLMDDSSTGFRSISTYCFTKEENGFLASKINDLLGFDCASVSSMSREGREYPYINLRWPKDKIEKYYELTRYIHPSYRYKLVYESRPCTVCGEEFFFHDQAMTCNKPMCRIEKRQKSIVSETVTAVESVTVKPNSRSSWVYDFEVKDNHNFIARRFVVHNCYDETDLIDPAILSEAAMIADPDQLGRPPIFIYISSRKSAFGPVQDKIDLSNDPKNGIRMHKWSLCDFMKPCPPSVHLPDEPRPTIHIHRDSLEIKSAEDYAATPVTMQSAFDSREVYAGCVECPALLICQGRAVQQKSQPSTILRDLSFIKTVLRETKDPEKIKAQLMNLKPESSGNVFNRFDRVGNTGSIAKAWEFAFSVPWIGEAPPTKRMLREMLSANGWYVTCGVDFGYVDPAIGVLVAHHRAFDKVIVLHTVKASGFSNPDWIQYCKERIFVPYGFDLMCPDTADKSSPTVAARLGMQCRSRKPHRIEAGISWLQNHIWSPTKQNRSLFVIDDDHNRPTIESLERYQYKRGPMGFVFDTFDPDSPWSHEIDALRYACDPWVVYTSTNMGAQQPKANYHAPLYFEHQQAKEEALKAERKYLFAEIRDHYAKEHHLEIQPGLETQEDNEAEGSHSIYFSF